MQSSYFSSFSTPYVTGDVGNDTSATISFSRPPGRMRGRTHVRQKAPTWHDTLSDSSTNLSSGITHTHSFQENSMYADENDDEGEHKFVLPRNLDDDG